MQNLAVRRCVTSLVTAGVFGVASLRAVQAQPRFASPFIADDHWAVAAARRAATLGLTPRSFGWGDGSLTQATVGWALLEATRRSRTNRTTMTAIVDAEWRRFAREFPAIADRLASSSADDVTSHESRSTGPSIEATAALVRSAGRITPVRSLDRTRENVAPPEPIRTLGDADLALRLGAVIGSRLTAEVAAGRRDGDWTLRDWQAAARVASLGAWAGKRAPAFGPGASGGLVFDGRAAFNGGGVAVTTPFMLPSLLRWLGPVRGETFLSRIDSSAATRRPWVFASNISMTPHPRLLLGATQAFMFSGNGQPPFTWRNFKEMFLTHGIKTAGREFENGIASIEMRWRAPLPGLEPVLYGEWGTDDNHSAWFKFPAVVAGATLPSLAFAPAWSVGAERASFAAPCSRCNGCACEYYATWYRHYVFMDGWTLDREPIGHPLGGDGTEWMVYGAYDDATRPLRASWQAFTRDRGRYNIFAPTRQGRSTGGRASAEYRLTPTLALRAAGELEQARSRWTASAVSAGLRWVP